MMGVYLIRSGGMVFLGRPVSVVTVAPCSVLDAPVDPIFWQSRLSELSVKFNMD